MTGGIVLKSTVAIVMLFSVFVLGEALNLRKVAGTLLVIGGLVVIARG